MIELATESREQTVALGRRVGQLARAGDVIALDGELGAGKTQFVRGLAEGMGLDPTQVSSPTFVFMHEYEPDPETDADGPVLVHIDAYRITGPDDLATLGFDHEILADAVTAVEWATKIDTTLGTDRLIVAIEHAGLDRRRITLQPVGDAWTRRLAGWHDPADAAPN